MTNRDHEDPGELADELDQEADQMQRRSDELGDKLEQVRQDWQRKRADQGVPGATPPDDSGDENSAEDNGAPSEPQDHAQAEDSG
jgi:hypothetical protein